MFVAVVPKPNEARPAEQCGLRELRKLYTHHALPDAVFELLNNGFGRLEHVLPNGIEPDGDRKRAIVSAVVSVLHKHLMRVDEKPTLTRFWTFREGIDKMFLMRALGFPDEVLVHPAVNPRLVASPPNPEIRVTPQKPERRSSSHFSELL